MAASQTYPRASIDPEVEAPGLWVHRGPVPPMRRYHRHDDIELNIAVTGGLSYLFGGERLTVPEGHTAVFWAAAPHRLIEVDHSPSDVVWLHLPLTTVLRWSLPDVFAARVLGQRPVVVPTTDLGDHVADQVLRWRDDLAGDGPAGVVELEANALLLRVLAAAGVPDPAAAPPVDRPARAARGSGDLRPVVMMARFLADRFRDPIGPGDAADAAGLNPNYATTLFRQWCGVTLGAQLIRHRVAEAQRLLLTTDLTTTAIAHAAGFGSVSSLYDHFARTCGEPPGDYRRSRSPGTEWERSDSGS